MLATTTLVSVRYRIGPVALLILFAVGIELRYAQFGVGFSDVPQTIRATIDGLAHGANPYLPVAGRPPFPYGPLALVWYAPFSDPRLQEFALSILTLSVLAFRGQPLGLALWATLPVAVNLASDGSNDHTAAVLLLVALLVLERMPRAGALLMGVAAGFKIYALAWLPPIFIWAGAGALVAGLAGAAVVWLPAVVLWGPGNILASFQAADAVHKMPYFSLGELLARQKFDLPRQTLDMFRLAAGALTAVVVAPMARTHKGVVVAGMAIYFVTLYAGYWSTPAYLIPPLLVLCWYLDLWLGPDKARVAWPSDPVGVISDEVDRRWPRVDERRDAARIAAQ